MKAKTIEISNWELMNSFANAIHSLGELELSDMSAMLNIAKMKRACKTALEDYDSVYQKIAQENAEKEEDGNFKIVEGNYIYPDNETRASAFKKITDLQHQKIELDLYEIPHSALENVKGINSNLLEALFMIIV